MRDTARRSNTKVNIERLSSVQPFQVTFGQEVVARNWVWIRMGELLAESFWLAKLLFQ